jgi:hypothetical protein
MSSIGSLVKRLLPQRWQSRWNKGVSKSAHWVLLVVFYTILANIPYWIVEREFGFTPLGWFCVQYATVGLIALVVPRIVTAVLLFVVILADLLCGICVSFNLPIKQCLENLRAADAFGANRWLFAIAASAAAILTAVIAGLLPGRKLPANQRWRVAACLTVFALLIFGADRVSIRLEAGHGPSASLKIKAPDGLRRGSIEYPRMCRLPFLRLVRLQSLEEGIDAVDRNGPASKFPIPSATDIALNLAGAPLDSEHGELPNVVLVVVESWGVAQDASLQQSLVEPYSQPDITSRYQVIQGSTPFNGSTIPGEARELCGSGFGFHLLTASASDLQSCLPDRFAAAGYHTLAVHGMSGRMFNRSAWHKTIGFQEQWFHDQLAKAGLHDCAGAFVGTCDADIAAWLGLILEAPHTKPYFVHWMTLNSHLPVPVPTHLKDGASCNSNLSLEPDTALCSWYQLISDLQQSVAKLASGPMSRPTVFVVVGDHAPPFGDPVLREMFSQSDVPYVILVPRSSHIISKQMIAHNSAETDPRGSPGARQTP